MLVPYAILSLLALLISAYVISTDIRRLANVTFAFFGLAVAAWAAAIGLAYDPDTSSLLFARLTFFFASLMLLGLVTFFSVFPSSPFPSSPAYRIFAVTLLIFSLSSFSPLLVQALIPHPSTPVLVYGPLHRPFGFFVYCSFATAFIGLCRRFRRSSGLARLQLRYLFLGLLFPAIGVTVTNLLVPLLSGVSTLGRYGPAFALVFLVLTAHALIHQRLLSVQLVVSRSAGYVLSLLVSTALCAPVIGFIDSLLVKPFAIHSHWRNFISVLPIALVFPPIHRLVQTQLDKYFHRDTYDYQRTIRDAMHAISTTLDFTSLARLLCDVLDSSLRVDRVSVYLRPHTSSHYSLHAQKTHHFTAEPSLLSDSPLDADIVALFGSAPFAVLQDDLVNALHPRERRLHHELRRLDALCAQPLSDGSETVGLVLLGAKRSGDPYFQDDLDLLDTIARHSAIAIKNAYLYQELLRVHDYVEKILATMESGVVAVNTEGAVVLFNRAAESITHLRFSPTAPPPASILPPQLSLALTATLSDGRRRPNVETLLSLAAGAPVPIIYSTSPLRDQDDSVVGAVAVFSDLTRIKQLESEKTRIERLASIGALASGIAHEIKNPLVAIRTFAELLPERFQDEEFRQDFSRIVVDEIDRIDDLVGRLRGLASPSHQPMISVEMCRLVDDTIALLRTRLEQCHISWSVEYEQNPCFITGDPARLKQLMLNLLMNAVEAMSSGGILNIRVLAQEIEDSHSISLEVSDSGPGIPEHLLTQIFEPFVTTKSTGSGLGLSICRGIADSHGATIVAHNRQDRVGATFVVVFPARITVDTQASTILHRV